MPLRKHLTTALLCLLFLTGVGLIAYPSFSDWWNSFHQSRAIMSYAEAVSGMENAEYDRLIGEAEEYNRTLSRTGIQWRMTEEQKENYRQELSFNSTGVMGYIDIPKIRVSLPVYHGIDENVLQTSIGHIEGTSLPVGGEGSHCVLSGHRGLPSARLFTDLDRLQPGDTWTITVLNETLTYECDQILVVLPEDISPIRIFPGQDYCTLSPVRPTGSTPTVFWCGDTAQAMPRETRRSWRMRSRSRRSTPRRSSRSRCSFSCFSGSCWFRQNGEITTRRNFCECHRREQDGRNG